MFSVLPTNVSGAHTVSLLLRTWMVMELGEKVYSQPSTAHTEGPGVLLQRSRSDKILMTFVKQHGPRAKSPGSQLPLTKLLNLLSSI